MAFIPFTPFLIKTGLPAELIKLNCSGTKFGLSIAYKFLTFVVSAWYREIYFF